MRPARSFLPVCRLPHLSPLPHLSLLALSALLLAGCGRRGHANTVAVTDALAFGDDDARASAMSGAPSCVYDAGAPAPCLAAVVSWFGSPNGLQTDPPDQAAAAAVAVVLWRDGHGEAIPAPDVWLEGARAGKGDGADALRLAMANRIVEGLAPLARALSSDDDARALMRAVARSVPGACDTYARLGAGADAAAGPPEGTADHSPCVQKDLERRGGPSVHGRYGFGLWRGAEGALALWKDAVGALRDGVARTDPRIRGTFERRVVEAVALLRTIDPKKLPPPSDYARFLGDVHQDAGLPFPERRAQ